MHFGYALRALWQGARLTRRGWNGPAQFIELQVPDKNSKMTQPYIYFTTTSGQRVPWVASQTDLLGDDWELAATHYRFDDADEADREPGRGVAGSEAAQRTQSSMDRVAADRADTLTCPKNADGMHRFAEYAPERDDHVCACGRGSRDEGGPTLSPHGRRIVGP